MAFILLAGYAEDFMGSSVYEGLTVGYCLALTQFLMVFALGIVYLRKADREYDPLAQRVDGRRRRGGEAGRAAESRFAAPRGRRRRDEVAAMTVLRRRQRRGARDLRDRPRRSPSASPTGRPSAPRAPSASTPPGRQITGVQNGLAISGDYLSAASFLGIAGLIFIYGFDGFLYSIGFLVAFLTVMFLLAERMRNAGKYTIADVLAFRLRERPARTAAALGTLAVVAFYLIAQMVGAGVLIQALVGHRLHARGDRSRAPSCSATWSSAAWSPPRGCRSSRPCC